MEKPIFPYRQDPDVESMNNFHGHMPGGFSRFDEVDSLGYFAFQAVGHWLEVSQDEWPEERVPVLLRMRMVLEIQQDIDRFLNEHADFAELWEDSKQLFHTGGTIEARERILRPIYLVFREKYSEEDLSK